MVTNNEKFRGGSFDYFQTSVRKSRNRPAGQGHKFTYRRQMLVEGQSILFNAKNHGLYRT